MHGNDRALTIVVASGPDCSLPGGVLAPDRPPRPRLRRARTKREATRLHYRTKQCLGWARARACFDLIACSEDGDVLCSVQAPASKRMLERLVRPSANLSAKVCSPMPSDVVLTSILSVQDARAAARGGVAR